MSAIGKATRLLLLLAILVAATLPAAPALALCVSRPDGAASRYVENNTAQALCLNREVSDTTKRLQLEGRLDAMQAEIAARAQRQRLLSMPVPDFTPPAAAW